MGDKLTDIPLHGKLEILADDVYILECQLASCEAELASMREALLLGLDQVDYTIGKCAPTEMVGACLPVEVIAKLRKAAGVVGSSHDTGTTHDKAAGEK